ncbi:alpha-L-fucosidase [Lachnotalea glycerini]|uniref:alpha-L-fucosidase n=2 Tax=Lachnotalea glycerini TaxID=1763509 RepID=A0A371JJ31_9FIRM|nr:alpha-L-fucosidase [Lachnotalea glycerini]
MTAAMHYTTESEVLKQNGVPEWFQDAKFGIFIHWGIYSIPAYGDEWYARAMYNGDKHWAMTQGYDKGKPTIKEHHIKKYGPLEIFGYKNFIDMWDITKYNPDEWIDLFEKAGAKYVMPVGIHHDSFALYQSDITPWNSVNKGLGTDKFGWKVTNGQGRDLIKELKEAAKRKGMYFGISNHLAENATWIPHMDEYDTNPDKGNDPYETRMLYGSHLTKEEEAERWLSMTNEIIDKYHPDMTYFDAALSNNTFQFVKKEFAAHYYNSALENNPNGVLFFYKFGAFEEGEAVLDVERGQLKDIRTLPWQTDTSISAKSWGYIEEDIYRNADFFISSLIDIVSKNGNLLLNIGPKADGSISEEVKQILLEIGEWLNINGEAIYNTRPWIKFGEGVTIPGSYYSDSGLEFTEGDIRFTKSKSDSTFYILPLVKPTKDTLCIQTLKSDVLDIQNVCEIILLDGNIRLEYKQTQSGLEINLPLDWNLRLKSAYAMKVNLKA